MRNLRFANRQYRALSDCLDCANNHCFRLITFVSSRVRVKIVNSSSKRFTYETLDTCSKAPSSQRLNLLFLYPVITIELLVNHLLHLICHLPSWENHGKFDLTCKFF